MKVLAITWACDAEDVSEPFVSYDWVRALSQDHDVTVLAVSKPSRYGVVAEQCAGMCEVVEWSGLRVPMRFERMNAVLKPGYLNFYRRARRTIRSLILERGIQVIHHLSPFAYRYPSPGAGMGVPLIRGPIGGGLPTPTSFEGEVRASAPAFMRLRGLDRVVTQRNPWLRSSYDQTDLALLIAPYVRNVLGALRPRRVEIMNEHGIDALPTTRADQCSKGSTKGPVRFLYVGRIARSKGLRDTIRAFAFANLGVRSVLDIVGDGEDRDACEDEARRLGVEESVVFHGWKKKQDVRQYYREADVFIFPSFREPSGAVVLEAMSYGLPCIVGDYGGPSYLLGGKAGIAVPLNTPTRFADALASAIKRMVEDAVFRNICGIAARKRITDHFLWQKKREKLNQWYAELTTNSNTERNGI